MNKYPQLKFCAIHSPMFFKIGDPVQIKQPLRIWVKPTATKPQQTKTQRELCAWFMECTVHPDYVLLFRSYWYATGDSIDGLVQDCSNFKR